MARQVNLGSALKNVEPESEKQPLAEAAAPPAEPVSTPRAAPAPARTLPVVTPKEAGSEPPYQRFARKETRLRDDQIEGLSAAARRLSRAKGPGGERITDNTLIRVAVDLLLARENDLAGGTEAEIRGSVSG